jgi:D-alanyl-D-alanine carboxypeptidase (penicillin-binding protein 5/6)
LVLVGKKNEPVGTVHVEKGQKTEAQAYLQADYWMLVEKGREKAISTTFVPQKLEAPQPAGTKAGRLKVFLDGRLIGEKTVITKEEVPRANVFILIWRRIRIFLRNLFR